MSDGLPRSIVQPGPAPHDRIVAVEARGASFSFDLEPGVPLVEAVRLGFADHGFDGGVVEFAGVALSPFAYVMPALSKTGENAAFYSDIFRPPGISIIDHGSMTFGRRDGGPFFHCHALWTEADGKRTGGHILPDETTVARRTTVNALGIDGAIFEANPDPETNFKLFGPVAAPSRGAGSGRVLALRLRPNQDFFGALERFCSERGIEHARIRGGVGSTIGARFADGRVVENFATEVYIVDGVVRRVSSGGCECQAEVGLVDYTGRVEKGLLKRGDNPVLMTFELALEVK